MDFIVEFLQSSGFLDLYHSFIGKVFNKTLEKDLKEKRDYNGFPTKKSKRLHEWSLKTGIPFVKHKEKDYTLQPIIDYIAMFIGGKQSFLYRQLIKFNRLFYGKVLKKDRFKAQLDLFESYLEYTQMFGHIDIINNLTNRDIPYYIIKMLEEEKTISTRSGSGFVDFVLRNSDYFAEVQIFFTFEEKDIQEMLLMAIEELRELTSSSGREFFIKATIADSILNVLLMLGAFGKLVIPEIIESFDVNIGMFSLPIIWVDRIAFVLVNRWYMIVLGCVLVFILTRTTLFKLLLSYMGIKIKFIKNYTINNDMVKFFKTYNNMSQSVPMRQAFSYGADRLSNHYLKHIFMSYLDGSNNDLSERALRLSEVLEEIPYIPQEYVDIITESEQSGKQEEGLNKVIALIEPRVKDANKAITKNIILWSIGVSLGLIIILGAIMYKDLMNIVNITESEFYDSLK